MPTPILWLLMMLFQASAAPMTRFADVPASSIGFWRVLGAAVVLSPWWLRGRRSEPGHALLPRGSLLAGFCLGAHFATWCWSLMHTTIANAVLFVGMQPLLTPFLGRWLCGDRLTAREVAGTIAACAGMAWILGGQVMLTPDQLPGSLMALLSMVFCAAYLVLARRYRGGGPVLLFVVPVYLAAAATQAVSALAFEGGIAVGDGRTTLALAALVLVPTVGGHTLAMLLLRRTTAHVIAISVPAQFVLNTIAAVFLFDEVPSVWFYPGAALVTAGVVAAVLPARAAPGKTPAVPDGAAAPGPPSNP
jgi:drug/metabolite transporter (DMT)-like permease